MTWLPASQRAFDHIFGVGLREGFPLAYEVLHQMAEGCAWTRYSAGINPTMTVDDCDIAMVAGLIDRMRQESQGGQDTSSDDEREAGSRSGKRDEGEGEGEESVVSSGR